ncbi:MAG: hypothetical protein ACJ762_06590 [Solirubrobacteraceae bacterium]
MTVAPRIAELDRGHPVRRWVVCLAMFAGYVLDGRVVGPFNERRAAHFARTALLPDNEFEPVEELADEVLAAYFNVPVEQIPEKREDLRARRLLDDLGP